MKKILAMILTVVLLAGLVSVHAEEAGKYDRLTVGTTTPFSGNFLSDALGSNIMDQDVRRLIHGYHLVTWDSASGAYQFNQQLVTAATVSVDGLTYTFPIPSGLTYNDGTPITARDYAFTLLLLGSPELKEAAGGQENISRILGGADYQNGTTKVLKGFRLLGDNHFSLTVDASYDPYFYQLKVMDIAPLPISVIAPGCTVEDDGNGVFISGSFTADLLKETLLDPETGYISHPGVSCGPYMLTDYDGESVTLSVNEAYIGDENGAKPSIPEIVIQTETADGIISDLAAEDLDLVIRCTRADQIQAGMMLMASGDYSMKAYSRAGLSFISFCADKGPTADRNVRRAVAMCMDKETLTSQYTGAYGTTVKGYYGIGQWMFMMANGTLHPAEGEEEDWADLTLDNIPVYELDPEEAGKILDEAGWNLNEKGNAYNATTGGVRCKQQGDTLVPLKLKLIYPEENGAGQLLKTTFAPYLAKAGISLEIEKKPMTELLEIYYGRTERDCDMIMLGTNFADVFDPSGEYDENGTSRLNGVTDLQLAALAVSMRSTEPGATTEYCRRWLAYQERRANNASEIPLYSDAYLDFHIAALQNYEPGTTGNWAIAIQTAVLSDYEYEETEDELGEDEEIFDW